MMGSAEEFTVIYPRIFQVLTPAENRQQAKEMIEIRDSVPVAEFQTEMNKQIAGLTLRGQITVDKQKEIDNAIDEHTDWNTSVPDSQAMSSHIQNGLVSRETASKLMGFDDDEQAKAGAEKQAELDEQLAGLLNSNPVGQNTGDKPDDINPDNPDDVNPDGANPDGANPDDTE